MTDDWENIDQTNMGDAFTKYLEDSRSSFKYEAENHPDIFYEWLDIPTDKSHVSILDVGCGNGFDTYYIAKYLTKLKASGLIEFDEILGVDKSAILIRSAQRRQVELSPDEGLGNLRFQYEDVYSMSLADNSFDRVYANYFFQHLSEPKIAFEEMIRVTKPGGKFFVTDTDWSSLTCVNVPHMSELFKHNLYHSVKNPMILPILTSLFEKYDAINSHYYKFERTFDIGMFQFSLETFRFTGVKP